jgi:hypothetical protein
VALALNESVRLEPPRVSPGPEGYDYHARRRLCPLSNVRTGIRSRAAGNPAAALYRARGHYARAVRLQCLGMLAAQLGQLATVAIGGGLLKVALVYVIAQPAVLAYVVGIDAPFLFPFSAPGEWKRVLPKPVLALGDRAVPDG